MFSRARDLKDKNKSESISSQKEKVEGANPKICLEFLPNGKVMPSVSWVPHSNVDGNLMANVINIMNEGKLYDAFRGAVIQQGEISGDVELAATIFKNIKNPKSIEDEKPLIRASQVTRLHFSQQGQNQEGDD